MHRMPYLSRSFSAKEPGGARRRSAVARSCRAPTGSEQKCVDDRGAPHHIFPIFLRQLVALLRKITCNLRHFMHVRHAGVMSLVLCTRQPLFGILRVAAVVLLEY